MDNHKKNALNICEVLTQILHCACNYISWHVEKIYYGIFVCAFFSPYADIHVFNFNFWWLLSYCRRLRSGYVDAIFSFKL